MATIRVKCPYCGSEDVVKYRRNSKTGREQFLCKNTACARKTFQLEYKNNAYSLECVKKKKNTQRIERKHLSLRTCCTTSLLV